MPFRRQALALLTVLSLSTVSLRAQSTPAGPSAQSSTVDFRVMLVFSDTHNFSTNDTSQPGVQSKSGSESGEHPRGAAANMQIRVQVLNSDGSTVGERSPNNEGTAQFRVLGSVGSASNRQYLVYRVRVFGSDIEETWVEDVQPGRGDSTITVALHRKNEKTNQAGAQGGLVSAAGLNVPSKAQKELEKGNSALAKGKLQEAIQHFQTAVEIYPKFDLAWNNLGVAKMKSGDLQGGREAFEKALQANDKSARAYVNLARIDMHDKNYAAASERLTRSLTVEPLNADALSLSCEAALLEGKTTEVVEASIKLHSVPHEGLSLCHYAAGVAYTNMNKPTEAVNEYHLFLKESPENSLAAKAREAIQELSQNVQAQSPKP